MVIEPPFGDKKITIDYKLAPQMVIFSHGFGVGRDGRGLLSDIATRLPEGVGHVLFDYNSIDAASSTVEVTRFSEQVSRLATVLEWTRQQPGVVRVDMIGHSLGCLVVAELSPENIGSMILMAPPTTPLGGFRRRRYTKRHGAELKDGIWHIPRSDGTTTLIPDAAFVELEQIDAEGELTKLAFFRPYDLVIAEVDDVLTDDDYTELIVMDGVTAHGIEGANHNFEASSRQTLIELINQLLESSK